MKDTKQSISHFLLLNFITWISEFQLLFTLSLWSKCFRLTIQVKPLQQCVDLGLFVCRHSYKIKVGLFREFLFLELTVSIGCYEN